MRVSQVARTLSTSAWPHTAPTFGSWKACTRMRIASFSSTESESTKAQISASVTRMPAAMAARLPRFSGKSMTLTRPPACSATLLSSRSVASEEPSLTATICSLSAG